MPTPRIGMSCRGRCSATSSPSTSAHLAHRSRRSAVTPGLSKASKRSPVGQRPTMRSPTIRSPSTRIVRPSAPTSASSTGLPRGRGRRTELLAGRRMLRRRRRANPRGLAAELGQPDRDPPGERRAARGLDGGGEGLTSPPYGRGVVRGAAWEAGAFRDQRVAAKSRRAGWAARRQGTAISTARPPVPVGSELPHLGGYPFEVRYSDGALVRATGAADLAAEAYPYFIRTVRCSRALGRPATHRAHHRQRKPPGLTGPTQIQARESSSGERPLALYVLAQDAGLADNDPAAAPPGERESTVLQSTAMPSLPFGGVGQSGTGRHYEIEGFRKPPTSRPSTCAGTAT